MKYTLNDYYPTMSEHCIRLDVFPNREIAAKLVAAYENRGFRNVKCCELFADNIDSIPTPKNVIEELSAFIEASRKATVFTGMDAYLAFLQPREEKEFIIGLRNLIHKSKANARILLSDRPGIAEVFANPKYQDGLQLVRFAGEPDKNPDLLIQLFPHKWVSDNLCMKIVDVMKQMGEFKPSGLYKVSVNDDDMPRKDYGSITVMRCASEVLSALYGLDAKICDEDAETLLNECKASEVTPIDFLIARFGGNEYLTKEKAARQLMRLVGDELWNLYIWLVKSRISQDSYLYQVLLDTSSSTQYWRNYVVRTALSKLNNEKAEIFASERADVLRGMNEPLIAEFVEETMEDDRAIVFLNCESEFEMSGLIRHAAKYQLSYGMPDNIKKTAPVLAHYLSPGFDYGNKRLTDYFDKLRCFRLCNIVDEDFVQKAYAAEIPYEIAKRDDIIAKYDDGDTSLLVVDGMGAEYYPLLLNMARQNGIGVAEQRIVCASLPTSTQFNPISWDKGKRLREVKRTDTISHTGYSAYEKCAYSDNLAEIFRVFRMDIIPRIQAGLKNNKRVVVTGDHGSSYLAVLAHKNKMDRTLPWNGTPEDWRYAVLGREIETPEGMISEYHANDKKVYYMVKGYNRLPKLGGKEYAVHGGATLEEMLVPFVVFTNIPVTVADDEPTEQLVENEDFDI